MQTFYTARLGIRLQQQRVDEIAANISNAETTGYKCSKSVFKDTLYTQISDNANSAGGTGVALQAVSRNFSSGQPLHTGLPLDLYINGDGFFVTESNDGNVMYTRDGSLGISNEAGKNYIVTATGNYVLDTNGERITLADGTNVTVSNKGELSSGEKVFAALKIVTFRNKDGLTAEGGGLFKTSAASGGEIASYAEVVHGCLESSNVDITSQFAQMISAQRALSLSSKAITAWNQMETEANNLRT